MSRSDATPTTTPIAQPITTAAPLPPGTSVVGRAVLGAAIAVVVVALTSACSGGSSGASTKSSPASTTGANGGAGRGTGAQQPPGTSGLIAAASPGLLEVQNQSGQTSVTYTAKTVFSQQETVTVAAVKAGECVSAVDSSALGAARSRATGSPTAPATPASPSRTPSAPVTITASTVTISQPVNGSCTAAGRGGFGAGRPSGSRPSGFPTGGGTRTGTRGGFGGGGFGGGFGGLVTGTVSSSSASAITVQAPDRQTGATVTDTVTLTSATKYVETVAATSAAAKVGQCANAVGAADSSGAVAATRIDISPPVNGSCTGGFGFGRQRGGAPQGGAPTSG